MLGGVTKKMTVKSTSLEAYHGEVKPKLGEKQRVVYDLLLKAKRPVCNQEIAQHLKQPINTITPRMNELVKLGSAEEAFKAAYPVTNRKVIYWRATQKKG